MAVRKTDLKEQGKGGKPSSVGNGTIGGLSREDVENQITRAERRTYDRAVKEARELFDLSLKIDDKVRAGVHDINMRIGWYAGIASFLIVVAGLLGLPFIAKWHVKNIAETVTEKYVSKEFQKHLDEFTDTKVSEMILSSVSNTEERIKSGFTKYMDKQLKAFEYKALELDKRIIEAESIINIYEKCASARSGNRNDYNSLVVLSGGTNRLSRIAAATVEEIKNSYEQRKMTLSAIRTTLTYKNDTTKTVPEDVMILIVHLDSIGQCDGAINSLADKGDKKYTATLIYAIEHSKHLDFVYAAIRGVEKLTGESFPALGIDETLEWWEKNKSDEKYHCLFEHYQDCSLLPNETPDGFAWRKAGLLLGWIKEMPRQYYSASQIPPMALFAKVDHEKAKGKKEILEFVLDYWASESPLPDNWYVYKTMYLTFYDPGKIIDFVNQRLETHPQFEDELKHWQSVFMPEFFALPSINWPSKKNMDQCGGND